MFPAADLIENSQRYDAYSALLSVYTVTTSITPVCKCSAIVFDEIRIPHLPAWCSWIRASWYNYGSNQQDALYRL